jgi:hypothetical protein
MTISIAVSSPRELGWRPAQTVFRGSWGGRPAAPAAETDEGGVRPEAALQVRWGCSVLVGVDGRVRPGEAFMKVASKLKLPSMEMRLFAGLSSPSRASRSLVGS